MVNYQNSKIYKIISDNTDDVYYGSTTQRLLCVRMGQHRQSYKKYINNKGSYTSSFEIIKYGDAKIVLIENHTCNSKDQLFKKERFYIESNDCVNIRIPGRTKTEGDALYYKNNKDIILTRGKLNYKNNKDIILARGKVRHNCVCGGKYSGCRKKRHEQSSKHQKYLSSLNI